jgi:hypothetical protein
MGHDSVKFKVRLGNTVDRKSCKDCMFGYFGPTGTPHTSHKKKVSYDKNLVYDMKPMLKTVTVMRLVIV